MQDDDVIDAHLMQVRFVLLFADIADITTRLPTRSVEVVDVCRCIIRSDGMMSGGVRFSCNSEVSRVRSGDTTPC